jgi:hypothetical protein
MEEIPDTRPIESIDLDTERIKTEIDSMRLEADEHAYMVERHGVTIGERGHKLMSHGNQPFEAPREHPVWADDLRHDSRILREMGEIGYKLDPWEKDYDKWPEAKAHEYEQEAMTEQLQFNGIEHRSVEDRQNNQLEDPAPQNIGQYELPYDKEALDKAWEGYTQPSQAGPTQAERWANVEQMQKEMNERWIEQNRPSWERDNQQDRSL